MKIRIATKHILLFLTLTVLIYSCQEKGNTISSFSLNKAYGIYKYKEKPFTGMVLDTTKSGRVLLTFYCNEGKLDGEYLEYYRENGNLKQRITYQNGKKTGPFIKLTKDGGKILSGDYVDFKKHGEWIEYYNNGKAKSKGLYKKGLQTGEWQFFFYNGKLKAEGAYLNGNESNLGKTRIPMHGRTGLWKFYSEETGKLEQESEFENGLRHGKAVRFNSNGQIEVNATFVDGKLDGEVEFFDENGILETKEIWKNGKKIK